MTTVCYRTIEAASEGFSSAYAPVVVTPASGSALDIQLRADRLPNSLMFQSLTHSGVDFSTGSPFDGFTVSVPGSGHMKVSMPGSRPVVSPNEGFITDATLVDGLWVAPETAYAGFSIPRSTIHRAFESFANRPIGKELSFLPTISPALTSTLRQLSDLITDAFTARLFDYSNLALASLEDAVLRLLLFTQPHSHRSCLHSESKLLLPNRVRRAMQYIDANCQKAITSSDIASEVGVSLRTLQISFARFAGVTPYQYLRERRMDGARHDLLSGRARSVKAAADRWGFLSVSQFSSRYVRTYGELPSVTLNRLM